MPGPKHDRNKSLCNQCCTMNHLHASRSDGLPSYLKAIRVDGWIIFGPLGYEGQGLWGPSWMWGQGAKIWGWQSEIFES